MTSLSIREIYQGLEENEQSPYGAARNAHAEALCTAAEASGDRGLFRTSLAVLIEAYEYSAERAKLVVPFARLLQEYDRDPAAFGRSDTHGLFWRFKWVAGLIVSSPDIPVATATRWLEDMGRRYRLAGYSERAVHQAEFHLADAIGDTARADRAIEAWRAAERDAMSDCHACEIHTQGRHRALQGRDEQAIEVWEPVLEGRQVCREEPHRVLARALLPLLRLGRHDQARAYHLRGYRMTRGNESLMRAVGEHIEFCALTGNEPRGLEILAEHAGYVERVVSPGVRLEFAGGVLVLLRRLTELGHGDRPAVPYQGAPRTVAELSALLHAEATGIAGRFDARNGNTHISDQLRARIAGAPLVEALPLGVRSTPLPTAAPGTAAAPVAAATAPGVEPLAGLVARARAARRAGHPTATALWDQVAARTGAGEELPEDPALVGDLLERRAIRTGRAGDDAGARALFEQAQAAHTAVGEASRAAFAALGVAGAAAHGGAAPQEVRALLAEAERAAGSLDPADPDRTRRIAAARFSVLRIEAALRHQEAEVHPAGPDAEFVTGLEAFVAAFGQAAGADGAQTADLVAEAETQLARIALGAGRTEHAEALLESAAERALAAGHPWETVAPLTLRAGLLTARGQFAAAEEAARTALGHTGEATDAEEAAEALLTLVDVLLAGEGRAEEAAGHALAAVHRLDRAGLTATAGARARQTLAQAYADAGRTAEAAEVLQSAVADLVALDDREGMSARRFLGGLLCDVQDWRGAAEQYLLAAETAGAWDHTHLQAHCAQAAADALSRAGLGREAAAAYERAVALWGRTGDEPVAEVRCLRSLAWLAVRDGADDENTARGRQLMDRALAVLDGAAAPQDPALRYERAQTWQQTGQLIAERVDAADPVAEAPEDAPAPAAPLAPEQRDVLRAEAVSLWERAAALYEEFGEEALEQRYQCVVAAAWTDQARGRAAAGADRLTALAAELSGTPGDAAARFAGHATRASAAVLE